jgi:hypothetical protein
VTPGLLVLKVTLALLALLATRVLRATLVPLVILVRLDRREILALPVIPARRVTQDRLVQPGTQVPREIPDLRVTLARLARLVTLDRRVFRA